MKYFYRYKIIYKYIQTWRDPDQLYIEKKFNQTIGNMRETILYLIGTTAVDEDGTNKLNYAGYLAPEHKITKQI